MNSAPPVLESRLPLLSPLRRINCQRIAYLTTGARHVGDFTRWKDHDSYREAFDRLLRDLKAEA